MRKGLDETLSLRCTGGSWTFILCQYCSLKDDGLRRRGLVRCCYRLLADVAAAGPLLGSAELLESGQLLSKGPTSRVQICAFHTQIRRYRPSVGVWTGEEPECFNFNLYSGRYLCS